MNTNDTDKVIEVDCCNCSQTVFAEDASFFPDAGEWECHECQGRAEAYWAWRCRGAIIAPDTYPQPWLLDGC